MSFPQPDCEGQAFATLLESGGGDSPQGTLYLLTLLSPIIDAQLEQLTVDSWSTPRGILSAHLPDQISDLARNDGLSGLAAPYLPAPEQSKTGKMPGNECFWLRHCKQTLTKTLS
jgi:hypothetical protein